MRRIMQGPLNIGKTIEDAAALGAFTQVTLTTLTAVTLTTLIPSTAKLIIIGWNGISGTGTSDFVIQMGTGGAFATGSYTSVAGTTINASSGSVVSSTAGLVIDNYAAASAHTGEMTLMNMTGNTWISSHSAGDDAGTRASAGNGVKVLGGTLDSLRITHDNTTDTFDAGAVRVFYKS